MASPSSQQDNTAEASEQANPAPTGSKTGLLSSVSRAASKGRTATLSRLGLGNRPDSSPCSPIPPGGAKGEAGTPRHQSLGSFSGISSTASSALRGLASGVGVGGGGGGGAAGSGGGSGSTTNSEIDAMRGRPAHELPSIRKGYLLMLRETGRQSFSGAGGGGEGVASGVGGGCEGGAARVGEWSERFFYLSGHFLRYKKQSRNLTSVNLTQTEHVEFNLQSATVETLEEAHQREQAAGGDEKASCPRRKHAFRLVTTTPTTPAAEGMRCSSPSLSASLMHCGAQGSTGGDSRHTRSKTLPGDVASASAAKSAAAGERGGDGDGEARESRSGSLSSARSPSIGGRASPEESGCVGKVSRQVWVLAATNSKERAMWMQAIREAISLGQEFLSQGEEGSLAALAVRMSKELEVRDRHHRLRFYRSCFIGEDAVSWLQSECGPCSVGEALSLGNKMIAAGLIYHSTYGHSLENSRLFYKFAGSVMSASKAPPCETTAARRASGGSGGTRSTYIIGRFGRGLIGGPAGGEGGSFLADGARPYRSTNDLAGIENTSDGGGGTGGSTGDYRISSPFVTAAGDRELDEMEGSDDGSASLVSSISGEYRTESGIVDEGEGGARARGGREGGGGGSCVKGDPVVAAAVRAGRRSVFREVSGDSVGEKKVVVKRMAREIEGLKLTCAEMERSQMRTELQMQAFATGLVACLETSTERALASTAAAAALAIFSLALHAGAQQQLLVQVITVGLAIFTIRSYAHDRDTVRRAIRAAKDLRPGGATILLSSSPASPSPSSSATTDPVEAGLGQGWEGSSGGRGGGGRKGATETTVAGVGSGAVPLLHPGQVKELIRTAIGGVDGGRSATTKADVSGAPQDQLRHPRSIEGILARMASNSSPVPPQLAEPHDPMSSSSAGPPFLPGLPSSSAASSREGRILTPGASADVEGAAAGSAAAIPATTSSSAGVAVAGVLPQGAEKERGSTESGGMPVEGGAAVTGGGQGYGGGVTAERPELASLPPEKEWPHHPIFVRLSPSVGAQVRLDGQEPNSSIPVNSDDIAVPFETPLFKGRLLVRVAGLPGDGAQDYFRGKKRLMQCAVQGQFKKELPFDRAYTGQAYLRPFTHLPAKWLIRSAFSVIRRLSPALREDITGDRPYMVSPLAATAQALRAEAPGDEAAIVGDLGEETGLLGASFMSSRVPASARKKFFSNPRNLQAYSFKPGVVYTFDFYQHLYNAVTFDLDLGFRRVKLADYLNHQPAQIMALDFETGEMLWNVEIWNAALLKMANGG